MLDDDDDDIERDYLQNFLYKLISHRATVGVQASSSKPIILFYLAQRRTDAKGNSSILVTSSKARFVYQLAGFVLTYADGFCAVRTITLR